MEMLSRKRFFSISKITLPFFCVGNICCSEKKAFAFCNLFSFSGNPSKTKHREKNPQKIERHILSERFTKEENVPSSLRSNTFISEGKPKYSTRKFLVSSGCRGTKTISPEPVKNTPCGRIESSSLSFFFLFCFYFNVLKNYNPDMQKSKYNILSNSPALPLIIFNLNLLHFHFL